MKEYCVEGRVSGVSLVEVVGSESGKGSGACDEVDI